MAAKGQIEKEQIIQKMLETFNGSFVTAAGKELRVPVGDVEIKIALTCAKDVLGGGNAVQEDKPEAQVTLAEPTAEELNAIGDLMASLGL